MNRLKITYQFFLQRISEASTWQAIGFLVGLFTARYSGMDWGQGAALGGVISAFIKSPSRNSSNTV